MKKKILSLCLVVAMVATAIAGASMAYLTDTEEAVNVMTVGNVDIELIEQQRNADHTALEAFKDNKILYPITGSAQGEKDVWGLPTTENYVDKIVTVGNIGMSDAYVRVVVAVPSALEATTAAANALHWNVGNRFMPKGDYSDNNNTNVDYTNWSWSDAVKGSIDGVDYNIYTVTYNKALSAKTETASAAFVGFYLDSNVDYDADTGKYTLNGVEIDYDFSNGVIIPVMAQAVQAAGFETAADAFAAAGFPANPWESTNFLSNASEIATTLTTLPDGTDIKTKVTNIVFGKTSDYPDIVNGEYQSDEADGVTAYYVPDDSFYTIYMLSDGVIYAPANSKSMFEGMTNVSSIDTSNLDFSMVQNALGMFANCSNLTELDTENWDVSNITNMQSIFYGCNKLEDIDVSNWDTSNCTNMRMVFFRCYALSDEVLAGVENWDVSNVENFYSMFKHCRALTSLDLSNWDTSSATTMSHLFANCDNLKKLDLSGKFNTAKVADMSWMFYGASKLTEIYVGDGWITAAVTTTTQPFYNNQSLVGGAGTTWTDVADMPNNSRPWESSAKLEYAIVDGGTENPGLLTYKAD